MDISIIIPLFNEEESLPELCSWIEKVMNKKEVSFKLSTSYNSIFEFIKENNQ